MTWTPKVGEWVVDRAGDVGQCGGTLLYGGSASSMKVIVNYPTRPFMVHVLCCLRPATIDEIPGNTVGEEEHDEALFEAGHGALAARNSATAVLREWLAISFREHVKPGRIGHEDWP